MACVPATAATSNQERVEQRIAALERQIEKDRSAHGRAVAALRRAEQALAEAVRTTARLEAEQQAAHRQLDAISAAILRQQQRLRGNQERLAAQLRARQALGVDPWIKVLLTNADPARSGRALTYLQYLQAAQARHIEDAREQLAELARLQAEARAAQATKQRLLEAQRAATESLSEARAQRERAVQRWTGTLQRRDKALAQLRNDQMQLEQVIVDLPATAARPSPPGHETRQLPGASNPFPQGPIRELRGRLGWPVEGTVQARYGTERQEGRMHWQGLLIGAPEGTPVRAVADGEVLFAAWMPYYGLVSIVDHGGGVLSLYGHNQTLLRQPGERVRAGDILGRVGVSGGRRKPALYFEIRNDGKPTNPERWLATR
ncbi:MAG TPA: peptidoglycan DD-metalloendopeptidase family protein [Candidatus Acidoferrales bacterium]|nr:peptidoglycan DD-metalloendopeptidase family protein [Candidatus Acidoferrales bacterium]